MTDWDDPPTRFEESDCWRPVWNATRAVGELARMAAERNSDGTPVDDLDDAAWLLARIRDVKATLAHAEMEAEMAVAELMGNKRTVVWEEGTLERYSGRKRTNWDHPRLVGILVGQAVDPESGEMIPSGLQKQVVAELLACAGLSYWRVAELKKRDLDADVFCDSEQGRPRVVLR